MRYGIIADVHANLRAFEACLSVLDRAGFEKLLFLGDLVGYGAEPAECIKLLRSRPNVTAIIGNHDRMVLSDPDETMRRTAAMAIKWTQDQLHSGHMRYLTSLPQGQVVDDTFLLVHGSLTARDTYVMNLAEIEANRRAMREDFKDTKVCFFGHTHVPMIIGETTIVRDIKKNMTFRLDPKSIYLINPGAVGQPRDACPLGSCGVFDSSEWAMMFFRVPYDVQGAGRAILAAGLPRKFARRLEVGG